MPRVFDVPIYYRSPVISVVKKARQVTDPRKRDLSPSVLDFGPVRFKISRHFGFCYGVENAIEIAYRALEDNPEKQIFLLSEMIHNPRVNEDLRRRGIQFLCDTSGRQLIPFDHLTPDDIVIVPAFGTTLEIQEELATARNRSLRLQHHLPVCREGLEEESRYRQPELYGCRAWQASP